jgi:hypothetical protein
MANDEAKSSPVVGAVAGVIVGMLVMGGAAYYMTRPAPLKQTMSSEEFEANKKVEKKEERAILSDLEKKFGPDHPQVKQMKMELGDVPFPETPGN